MKLQRLLLLTCVAAAMESPLPAQSREDYEHPPINYSATLPTDPITALESRLGAGDLEFKGSDKEILRALLRELRIPLESQILVFSKTSLQRGRIQPERPRALYFSDTCYVGWVPGGLIEVASMDTKLGPVFYSFEPRAPREETPRFTRDNDCLRCHGGSFVRGVPGVFARSVFTDRTGEPLLRHGSELVDHRTPFEERWGGWYVTGKHGDALHRGNVIAHEDGHKLVVDLKRGANITSLSPFFDTAMYLTGSSDIVALLVFEHQIAMHNAITRAGFACRRMIEYQRNLQRDLKEPVTDELVYDSVKSVFASATQDLLDHLLFFEEAPLPDGIEGLAGFEKMFQSQAPRARDGSSLKDLRLDQSLFRNRCSYLVYSESFLALPELLKRRVYERLAQALHPTAPDARYAYLDTDERRRIAAILCETHPEFPNYFDDHRKPQGLRTDND